MSLQTRPKTTTAVSPKSGWKVPKYKGFIGILGACLLWEAARWSGLIDGRDLPSLYSVAESLFRGFIDGPLTVATFNTLSAWLIGLVLATSLGSIFGLWFGLSPMADALSRPFVEFLRPIPSAALIPIALVLIGLSLEMQIALIIFASVWPVLFLFKAGVESTDPRYYDVARVLGLSRISQIKSIVLINGLPALATGVRTASAIALILTITVELVTGQPGLGAFLSAQQLAGQTDALWAGVFVAGLLGYSINAILLAIEKKTFHWSEEHREAQ